MLAAVEVAMLGFAIYSIASAIAVIEPEAGIVGGMIASMLTVFVMLGVVFA